MRKNRRQKRVITQDLPAIEVKELPQEPVYYTDIAELPLLLFIRCQETSDVSPLIISGQPSRDQLEEAWTKILSDYYSIVKTTKVDEYIKISRRIAALSTKKAVVECLVGSLRLGYNEVFIQQLRSWGYKYSFSEQSLQKDLDKVTTSLANDIAQLLIVKKKQEGLKESNGEKPSRQMYEKIIFHINNMSRNQYRVHDFTVMTFAIAYKELIDFIAVQNKSNGVQR